MSGFISFAREIRQLLTIILSSAELHAKWLNTLSYLENCGARKIAACEHPTLVKEEMLKHAAEEFRHAHYLKCQIERISVEGIENYSLDLMLGGIVTLHYLNIDRSLRGVR
jgi:bacterioferritin (cytochrome b1)